MFEKAFDLWDVLFKAIPLGVCLGLLLASSLIPSFATRKRN